jgi:predicted nucleotidyltransferase
VDLKPEHFEIIRGILGRYVPGMEVRAFGSRVSGVAERFSDLDLALVSKEPIPWEVVERLKEAFMSSDLPFRVDVVDWAKLDPEFQNRIGISCKVFGRDFLNGNPKT